MRTKKEILHDSNSTMGKIPLSENITSVNQYLSLEVLIDIRDILNARLISIDNTILEYVIPK